MPEKILIVDDDVDTLKLVGLIVQRQGYEVRVASSGAQALAMLQSEVPDLLLLDIMMPEMDGYEVARKMREDPRTAEVPIIMFTAKSQLDDKVAGFEAGADDYLTKPTQPRELLAHIKAVLARVSKSRLPVTPSQSLAAERGYMVGILGVKGGLGVSTVAINLGIAIRENNKKEVIVADFRPGMGTIGLELGYQKAGGINYLLEKKSNEITIKEIDWYYIHPACDCFFPPIARATPGMRVRLPISKPSVETCLFWQNTSSSTWEHLLPPWLRKWYLTVTS